MWGRRLADLERRPVLDPHQRSAAGLGLLGARDVPDLPDGLVGAGDRHRHDHRADMWERRRHGRSEVR